MKKLLAIIISIGLMGAGCVASTPKTDQEPEAKMTTMSGPIVTVAENSFVMELGHDRGAPLEKITVTYDQNTRFAVPDGSGIGAPIAKPEIQPGLQVEVQGFEKAGTVRATNIIFNAE